MNAKKIDISLRNQILANDKRIRNLINKDKKEKNKTKINEDSKENKSYLNNKQNQNNHKLNTLTDSKANNDVSLITISSRNNESLYYKDNINKKNKVPNQKKINKNKNKNAYLVKNSKTNDTIDLDDDIINMNNHKSFIGNKNRNYINLKNDNPKNDFKSNKNKKIITEKNNNYRNKKYDYINTDSSKLEQMYITRKSSIDIKNMIERFELDQLKKKEKLEKLKKQRENKEKEEYTYKPKFYNNAKYLTNQVQEDFITRQKKFNELKSQKEKNLKETLLKNEQEKINKSNFILQKKIKEYSNVGNNLDNSFLSEISCTKSMVEIDNSITRLFEWENRRKQKIINKRNEKTIELEKNKHIPTINKRSISMVINNKKNDNDNIFEKLYKDDQIIKEKKRIMAEVLKPSFKPVLYLTVRKNEDEEIEENITNNKLSKRNTILVNRNKNIKPKSIKTEDNIVDEESEKINDEILNIYRRTIINNMSKKTFNNSVEKRKSKRYSI